MGSSLGISGAISGMDWGSIVDQLMQVESRPLLAMRQKQVDLQAKADAWRDVNLRLRNLEARAKDLSDKTKFYGQKATSSATDVLDATASSGAASGTYQLNVVSLAKAHVVASGAFASSTDALAGVTPGSITINGKAVTVAATDSLGAIRDRINSTADIGVTASVMQVSNDPASPQYQLVLTSSSLGTPIAFSGDATTLQDLGLTTDASYTPNTIQAATKATLTIGDPVTGITAERNTNTFSDVIPGVTLTLKQTGSSTVQVQQDQDAAVKAVKDFVDQYNSVMGFLDEKASWDPEKKKAGILFGDPAVNDLKSRLRTLVTDPVSGGTLKLSSQVGVSTGKWGEADYGTLRLDETKLRDALAAGTADVAALFGANGNTGGIGSRVHDYVLNYTETTTGLLDSKASALKRQIDDLGKRMESMQDRLLLREETMRKQFTAMEAALSRLKSQSSALGGLLAQPAEQ